MYARTFSKVVSRVETVMVLITASTISEWTRAKRYRGRNNIDGASSRTRLRLGRGEIGGVICCIMFASAGGGCGLCKW
jgi:hypothetical protein